MKKAALTMMCLAAMMAAGTGLRAQEVTISLNPGWNWISYPYAVSMTIDEALANFQAMVGDQLKSKTQVAAWDDDEQEWSGSLTNLTPGQGYMYYSSRTEVTSFVFANPYSSFVTTAEPTDITATSAVVSSTVTIGEGNHVYARGVCWGTEPNPNIDGSHTSDDISTGVFTTTLIGLTQNTTYYVRAYVVTDYGLVYSDEKSFITLDDNHAYVDLGLPSGLLWATCNVGADNPEDYGDYFAWGEIQPKDTYYWETYQYCYGSRSTLTKYCNNSSYGYNGFTDNLTTLLPEDDAATANWGNSWRMPTQAEWQELLDNTTVTWTTQNDVNGRLFTAANGNSLFLPAAGNRWGGDLYGVGSYGYYWSSSLNTYGPGYEWDLDFGSDYYVMGNNDRYIGQSVRPVRVGSQNNTPTGAINGKFTINEDGDQVYFSQGNLQYIGSATTPYWKFAENQWDYLGTTTGQNSSNQNVDRDMFGWGTSGYNHGAVCYQPWSTSQSSSDYYAYGAYTNNLYDGNGLADWGYNAISNGGNTENSGWRTLTHPEWDYVFHTRSTTSGIRYAKATVNGVNGVVLLPDTWTASTYTLNKTNDVCAYFTTNTITAEDWANNLEANGAVFLPAAGDRWGTTVGDVGSGGLYWSSSYFSKSYAYSASFDNPGLYTNSDTFHRYDGLSVRLVRSCQ